MLFWAVLAFICFIAFLAVPVEVVFDIERRETFKSSIFIIWLFGVVRAPLPMTGSKSPSDPKKKKDKKKKKGKKGGGRRAIAIARNAPFRQKVIRFIRDFFGAVRISGLTLHARLGFDDPADTGMLWGLIGPMAGFLATIKNAAIRIEPEFMGERFELDSRGKVKVIPLQFLFIAVMFILSPTTIQMIWALR